jgi:hypothetical protein
MKTSRSALLLIATTLIFFPDLAEASTAISTLGSATATNSFDNANYDQTWTWNTLVNGPGLLLSSSSTAGTNAPILFEVSVSGAYSASNVGSSAAQFINDHTGTNSYNNGVVGSADGGSHNAGVTGNTSSTDAADSGVIGHASGATGATYGVYGIDDSSAGYAGYFNNSNGGYAAAFMGGNVGIGTATPQSLVHAYGGEVQVGSSGASCATANNGALRFSGSTLYYCTGTTWTTIGGGSGTVTSSTAGQVAYYQSTGSTVIGSSTLNIASGNVGIGTTSPTNLLSLSGSAAQTIWMERNPTSNTAGNNLTVQASGATSGATNKNGGNLLLSSGISTGTATSQIQFQTFNAGSSGTADNSATTQMTITGAGDVGIGNTTPGSILEADGWISTQNYVTINTGGSSGITWDPTGGTPSNYAIYRGAGAWSGNYTQLQVHWITGIVIDGGTGFGKSGTILQPNGGDVGIGNSSPSYTLQVNGSVAGTSAYVNTSDIRLKKNIQPLDVGLKAVEQLKPVMFEWKDEAFKQWTSSAPPDPRTPLRKDRRPNDPAMQGKQIGFIAQDVEKILPSVVVTEDNTEKTKGMKYSELIPVLVKAIQEQQTQLTKDEATIAAMKAKLGM